MASRYLFLMAIILLSAQQSNSQLLKPIVGLLTGQVGTNIVYEVVNCTVAKVFNGVKIWEKNYDSSGIRCNGRMQVLGKEKDLYVAFETYGPSNSPFYINRKNDTGAAHAFETALFTNYGYGDKTFVTVLVRIDVDSGELIAGTFLMSKMCKTSNSQILITSCKSYEMTVKGMSIKDDKLKLVVRSVGYPPSPISENDLFVFSNDGNDGYDKDYNVGLSLDLSHILYSERKRNRFLEASGSMIWVWMLMLVLAIV